MAVEMERKRERVLFAASVIVFSLFVLHCRLTASNTIDTGVVLCFAES